MTEVIKMRINARLDSIYEDKIKRLAHETKENVTNVLKKAIDLYYQHIQNTTKQHTDIILKSTFIGCADGDKNLSSNYKKLLKTSLKKKWS